MSCFAILAAIKDVAPTITPDPNGMDSSAVCPLGVCANEFGGWDPTYDKFLVENEKCNMRKVSSRGLSAEDFRKVSEYPVIVEDLSNWKCQLACSRYNLEKVKIA